MDVQKESNNSNLDDLQLLSKKEDPTLEINKIKEIISKYFSSEQFDDFLQDYISKMIYYDRPDNVNELKQLIGDFLEDRLKYQEDKKDEICKDIFVNIYGDQSKKKIRKAILADKLDKPVKLCDIMVGSKNKSTSISFNTKELTFELEKLYNPIIIQNIKAIIAPTTIIDL